MALLGDFRQGAGLPNAGKRFQQTEPDFNRLDTFSFLDH
jgi:hypothetical protein